MQLVTCSGETLSCPQLWSNADEADLRVLSHCVHSAVTQKLIFSPDTDMYHIGLTIARSLLGGRNCCTTNENLPRGIKISTFTQHEALYSDLTYMVSQSICTHRLYNHSMCVLGVTMCPFSEEWGK